MVSEAAAPLQTSVATRATSRRPQGFSAWVDRWFHVLSVVPTTLIMLLIFGVPLAFSFYLSLQGWTPNRSLFGGGFVGLENFEMLLAEPAFMSSLFLTIGYTLVTVVSEMLIGLGIASLLNKDVPFMKGARAILIMPMMMTPIVAALCWRLLLDPEYGFVNFLIGQKIVWIGDPFWAPISVAVVNIWQNSPYVAILLLAGLRSLPSEPVEAAQIDGASRWQIFWHVTLPALKPAILVALLLRTIFEFRAFDNVYVMTGGGPAGATNLLSIYTYSLTFLQFDFTLGAAASWLMLVCSVVLCVLPIVVFRFLEKPR